MRPAAWLGTEGSALARYRESAFRRARRMADDGGGAVDGALRDSLRRAQTAAAREKAVLDKAAVGASFPVPTPDNPDAVYVDTDARLAALERLDASKRIGSAGGAGSQGMSARKKKLLEIKKRQAAARADNQKKVVEEHRRLNSKRKGADDSFEGDQPKEGRKQDEQARALEHLGVGKDKAYLLETAASAESLRAKSKKKRDNVAAAFESHHTNQDFLQRSYENGLKRSRAGAGSEVEEIALSSELEYGQNDSLSKAAKERLAKSLARKESSMRRVRARLDEEDVTAINSANERYNQIIAKTLDKYTVELRQNLERGTAL